MSARDEQVGDARLLRSGDVAGAAGVNVQTFRYYERRGLLTQPDRNGSGHRQYPPHTVTLVRMIKNAQRLGLSLEEIAGVIAGGDASGRIESIATRKGDRARGADRRAHRDPRRARPLARVARARVVVLDRQLALTIVRRSRRSLGKRR